MQNDAIKERTKLVIVNQKLISQLDLSKRLLQNEYRSLKENNNIVEFVNNTVSTHKNSSDSCEYEKEMASAARTNTSSIPGHFGDIIFQKQKVRTDNFGHEIKKGGKHKIAFFDDLRIVNSLKPIDNSPNDSNKKVKNKRFSLNKNRKNILLSIRTKKRSNTLVCDRSSMMKNVYNMSKIKTKSTKKFKKFFVDIINVENLKKETKMNTFSVKNRKLPLAEEENVSCSCYCSIW